MLILLSLQLVRIIFGRCSGTILVGDVESFCRGVSLSTS